MSNPDVHLDEGERATPLHLVPTCMHLRHKLMYVDARHMTRGLVDDSSETRQYWCMLSQDARGADGAGVTPSMCGSGRPCFHGRPQSTVALRTMNGRALDGRTEAERSAEGSV